MGKSSRKGAAGGGKGPRKKGETLPGGFMVLAHASSKKGGGGARYMYYKRHEMDAKKKRKKKSGEEEGQGEEEEEEEDGPKPNRTLFVCNVPRAFSFEDVASVFSCFGQVEQVLLRGGNPMASVFVPFSQQTLEEAGGGAVAAAARDAPAQSAYVVYESRAAVDKAVEADVSGSCQPYVDGSGAAGGMRGWLEEYKSHRPDPARLQAQVDRFMEGFDRRTEMERRAAAAGPVVDEDGFTLVTRRSRNRTKSTESTVLVRQTKKRKSDRELLDFYRFQRREKKKEELAVLRRKFDEDKRRVAQMKEQRRFKPF